MEEKKNKENLAWVLSVPLDNQMELGVISAIMQVETIDRTYHLQGMEYGQTGVQGVDMEDGTDTQIPYCIIMSVVPASTTVLGTVCLN